MSLFLEIESCRDCPRLKYKHVKHFLLHPAGGYEYICTKANRNVMPSEGVKPPPKWCPIRKKNKEQ